MRRRSHRGSGTTRRYPRTARLNQLVQEIVADEVERIDDDRLGFFTVVAVEVESDLRHATVWYSTLEVGEVGEAGTPDGGPDDGGDAVTAALADHRSRLQAAIASQARMKRTPELTFAPDTVIAQANRVEEILRDIAGDRAAPDREG